MIGESTGTLELLSVVWSCTRRRPHATPCAVACVITAACWFTSSISFADPAVTLARALSDSFAGVQPIDTPAFIAALLPEARAATAFSAGHLPAVHRPLSGPDEVVSEEG